VVNLRFELGEFGQELIQPFFGRFVELTESLAGDLAIQV